MGCGCRGTRRIGAGGKRTAPSRFQVTLPDGTERVYLSPVEAKVAVRKAGGGTIRRVPADT